MNTVEAGLRGYEKMADISGYNIDGLTNELMSDPDFVMDIQIISCEIDISKYINPKSSALLKIIKKSYEKNNENKIKKQFNGLLNDKNKLDQIINLDKK